MERRLEDVAKLDDSVNADMEPEEALRLLLEDETGEEQETNEGESLTPPPPPTL